VPLILQEGIQVALENCKRCGNLYNKTFRAYCPKCTRELDEAFKVIKEYLKHFPKANMNEISQATNISSEVIACLVKEGRLNLA